MTRNLFKFATGTCLAAFCTVFAVGIYPIVAGAQAGTAARRLIRIVIHPSDYRIVRKAHVGIYMTTEYTYSQTGKLSTAKKNDLLIEQDIDLGRGVGAAGHMLPHGEYEIHVQPEASRTVIKKFILDHSTTAGMELRFDPAVIVDAAERNKTELVRIGPSLASLEDQIRSLSEQVSEIKRKSGR